MEIHRKTAVATYAVVPLINASDRPNYKASPTLAAGDVKVIRHTGGAWDYSNIGTLPAIIGGSATKQVLVTLTATELTSDNLDLPIVVQFIDQTSPKEWDDQEIVIWTKAHPSDVTHIDAQATSGNNASLKLKTLDIQNNAGVAVNLAAGGGNYDAISAVGSGNRHGAMLQGGASAGSAGLAVFSQGSNYALRIYGGGATYQAVSIESAGGTAMDIRGYIGLQITGGNSTTDNNHAVVLTGGTPASGDYMGGDAIRLQGGNRSGTASTGGNAIKATGGNYGNAVYAIGGSVTGDAIRADGTFGHAVYLIGGNNSTSCGMKITGLGQRVIYVSGGNGSVGMEIEGGATGGGAPLKLTAKSGDAYAAILTGFGVAGALDLQSGAGAAAVAVNIKSNAVSGAGHAAILTGSVQGEALRLIAGSNANAVSAIATGAAKHGIESVGGVSGAGLALSGGYNGLQITGGTSATGSNHAVIIIGGTPGSGDNDGGAGVLIQSGNGSGAGSGGTALRIQGYGKGIDVTAGILGGVNFDAVTFTAAGTGHGFKLVKGGGAGSRDIYAGEIGEPAAVDGGTASLAGILAKIVDDLANGGAAFDATTDSLEKISNVVNAGSTLTAQQVRDALKLAASAGAPAVGSIDDYLLDMDVEIDDIHTDVNGLVPDIAAIGALLTTVDGKVDVVSGNVDTIVSKLPVGSISGFEPSADTVDSMTYDSIFEMVAAMVNGRYRVDFPNTGDVTFYKRNNADVLFVAHITATERTRL